jgi:hypothetical protein
MGFKVRLKEQVVEFEHPSAPLTFKMRRLPALARLTYKDEIEKNSHSEVLFGADGVTPLLDENGEVRTKDKIRVPFTMLREILGKALVDVIGLEDEDGRAIPFVFQEHFGLLMEEELAVEIEAPNPKGGDPLKFPILCGYWLLRKLNDKGTFAPLGDGSKPVTSA